MRRSFRRISLQANKVQTAVQTSMMRMAMLSGWVAISSRFFTEFLGNKGRPPCQIAIDILPPYALSLGIGAGRGPNYD